MIEFRHYKNRALVDSVRTIVGSAVVFALVTYAAMYLNSAFKQLAIDVDGVHKPAEVIQNESN